MLLNPTTVTLGILFSIFFLGIAILFFRTPLFFRMGFRNIRRRPSSTFLIIVGAMMGTAVISASFTLGDSLKSTIENDTYIQFGEVDEYISVGEKNELDEAFGFLQQSRYISSDEVENLITDIENTEFVENVLPILSEKPSIRTLDENGNTLLSASSTLLIGTDIEKFCAFEKLTTCPEIGTNEAILTYSIAKKLDVKVGDTVVISFQNNDKQIQVGYIGDENTLWDAGGSFVEQVGAVFLPLSKTQSYIYETKSQLSSPLEILLTTYPQIAASLPPEIIENPPKTFDEIPLQYQVIFQDLKPIFDNYQNSLPAINAINHLYISNTGDVHTGLEHSDEVTASISKIIYEWNLKRGLVEENGDKHSWDFVSHIKNNIQAQSKPSTLLSGVPLSVSDIKQQNIDSANLASAGMSSMFLLIGFFIIFAGILLIVNIFVLLAVERKAELGILRAIGLKRKNIVTLFYIEGFFYSIISSVIGTFLGVGISRFAVWFINSALDSIPFFDSGKAFLAFSTSSPSMINAFLLGNIITLTALLLTSNSISKINIIKAIRDIKVPEKPNRKFMSYLFPVLSIILGAIFIYSGFGNTGYGGNGHVPQAFVGPLMLIFGISIIVAKYIKPEKVYTATALIALLFTVTSYQYINNMFDNEYITSLMGISIVISTVILILFNDRFLLWPINKTIGKSKSLQASIKMIITFPLSERFRTGMTLVMYSIIIFVVTIISIFKAILNDAIVNQVDQLAGDTDLQIMESPTNPIDDIITALQEENFDTSVIDDIVSIRSISLSALDINNNKPNQMESLSVIGLTNDYYEKRIDNLPKIVEYDENLFTSETEVWKTLLSDQQTIILDGRFGEDVKGGPASRYDYKMINLGESITVCNPLNVTLCTEKTVIGRTSANSLESYVAEYPIMQELSLQLSQTNNNSLISINDDANLDRVYIDMQKALAKYGVSIINLQETISGVLSLMNSMFLLMQVYLGIGVIIGIIGLSIIMIRAVNERTKQIGVLRAIGFQKKSVIGIFLGEVSFISLLGITIGVILGILVSYAMYGELFQDIADNVQFMIPWTEIAIIVSLSYIFSLIGTFFPTKKAGNISPAEVLRDTAH